MASAPPVGGDQNRAGDVHAFTWALCSASIIVVAGRMYSRARLTRNLWWDDWCILVALILDVAISITWSLYANKGYARHLFYLTPDQTADALKLNVITRCGCIMSIAIGKISVAFLIERIICPTGAPTARPVSSPSSKKRLTGLKGIDWRRAFLRAISGSVALSATVTVILFYVQCKPASALWDHRLLPPNGTAKCWNPIPVNTWDLVIASYWSLLDFLLALFPLPLILSLHLPLGRRILLSLLLSMGIFAGIAAAIKTSKVPISVKGKEDITWQTVELLLWNGIEMNIIIIAACIPTLRPVVLVLLRRGEELRDFGDDSSHRGAAGAKSAGIGHQQQQYHNGGRAQSYYFGRQFGPRRRSSIPLYSNASCSSTQQATYHSAKTTSSGTSPTKQQRGEYQQQQQQKSQCASLSDDSTTLEQSTPSPFHEKDLEARIHVSTDDLPSSRDSLNTAIPRPLEIYKSVQLTRTTSKADEDTATGHDNDDEECWDLTCSAHRRGLPPPPLPVIRHIPITPSSPLGGNSWQQKAFEPLTIIDPDAITEAPASPLPIYRLHSTPPHLPPSNGTAGSGGGGDDDGVTQPSRKRSPSNNNNNGGLSAPLSEIGRPSPPGRSRSRSVKAVAGGSSSSSSSNSSNNSNSRDGDSKSGERKAG